MVDQQAEVHVPPVGEMVITTGGFFGKGMVGIVIGSDEKGTSLVRRLEGNGNIVRVRNEDLSRAEQKWVEVPW